MIKLSVRKIFLPLWFSLVVIFFIWNRSTFQSRNIPADTFINSDIVSVFENDDRITFKPATSENKIEVIFFQGGLADPRAYAPLCRKLAENGFICHLIKMKWRLPQYDYNKVSELFDLAHADFVIGGHSQGGKMAAQFVYENPEIFKGLFLMGTSHPRDIDLSNTGISCLKLYAENDGLASVPEVLENKAKLPGNTKLVFIKGGNHSQFGYLGRLLMDDSADITLAEQQQQIFDNLIIFLSEIEKTNSQQMTINDGEAK